MAKVVVYSKAHCPYCVRAKQLLTKKQVHFDEIAIDQDPEQAVKMVELTGRKSVPQIIINGEPVGGFDDLWALEQKGALDPLLNADE